MKLQECIGYKMRLKIYLHEVKMMNLNTFFIFHSCR